MSMNIVKTNNQNLRLANLSVGLFSTLRIALPLVPQSATDVEIIITLNDIHSGYTASYDAELKMWLCDIAAGQFANIGKQKYEVAYKLNGEQFWDGQGWIEIVKATTHGIIPSPTPIPPRYVISSVNGYTATGEDGDVRIPRLFVGLETPTRKGEYIEYDMFFNRATGVMYILTTDEKGVYYWAKTSGGVSKVNGKTGDVSLEAHDIPYDGTNVDIALALAEEHIETNANNIDSLEQQLEEHIDNKSNPHEVTAEQVDAYTKGQVDDKINQSAAHYLTKRTGTEGHYSYPQFATHADLAAAKAAHTADNPQFFYGIEPHTPDKNDYCVVLNDETHDHETTRYAFVGEWDNNGYFRYQYTINETPLTEEQWAAINSLISRDEDGNLVFNGHIIVGFDGTINEEDPIFTAWKNEMQIALGNSATTTSGKYKQIAIGAHATANGQNAIALGSSEPAKTNGPKALAQNAIAIGAGAVVNAVNAIQLLAGTNNTSGTIQLGNKVVAFLSDIPISSADVDDFQYYKGHYDLAKQYYTGDIVRAVNGEGTTIAYFKALQNSKGVNPFSFPAYWARTQDDEGLDKLLIIARASVASLTGADISVSPSNGKKLDVAIAEKIGQGENTITADILVKASSRGIKIYDGATYAASNTSAGIMSNGILFVHRKSDGRYIELNPSGIKIEDDTHEEDIAIPLKSGTMALDVDISGITEQDIKNFLNYRGGVEAEPYWTDGGRALVDMKKDEIYVYGYSGYIYLVLKNIAKGEPFNLAEGDSGQNLRRITEDYYLTEGFQKLVNLFGTNNYTLAETIESRAIIYLKFDGTNIKRGDNTITSYEEFLRLVQTGRVILQATATPSSGSSPVLFRPQLMNGNAVLFDATGEIAGVMRTRNINVKRVGTDGIEVVSGGLKTLALTSDLTNLAKKSDLAYALVNVGADGVLTDRAINVTSAAAVTLPSVYTDLVIRASVTESLPVSVPDGVVKFGDAFPAETGEFLVTITKTGANEIYVRTLKIEEVS